MMLNLDEKTEDERTRPVEIRVPFLHSEFGLGDAVKQLTQAVGVHPCTPCKQRQEYLNARVQFRPWGSL